MSEPGAGARRPNVLMFLTDQLRWDHVGFGGNDVVATPHLDRLAASGTVFERTYVGNPICMPNRATIFTGRMPTLHRVRANGIPLDPRQETFPETLRRAGYSTGYIGKLHLQPAGERLIDAPGSPLADGDAWRTTDLEPGWNDYEGYGRHQRGRVELPRPFYGFEDCDLAIHHGDQVAGGYEHFWRERGLDIAALRGPDHALPHDHATPHAWRTAVPEEAYSTNYVADRAIDSLHRYRTGADPFLLVVSFPDPHHPFTPPGRYWDMYDPTELPIPETFDAPHRNAMGHHDAARDARGQHLAGGPIMFSPDEAQFRRCLSAEYGMVSLLDDGIGRVLAELDRLGLAEDTIVIFTSDHGDMMGDHGLLFKVGCHWDACTRVPLVVRAPGRAAGRTSALASSTDIAPTVLDLCGVTPYAGIQGTSLSPQMDDPTATGRGSILIEEDQLFPVVDAPMPTALHQAAARLSTELGVAGSPLRMRTVITDEGRLTWYRGSPRHELYDNGDGPEQTVNRWDDAGAAGLRRDLTERLAAALVDHADDGPLAREFA